MIAGRSWIEVVGLELRNNLGVNDGSGVRVLGAGSHIELRQNRIHDIRGKNAMGITVFATAPTPVSDLVIDGNEIYDCDPAPSETLTLNGNVDGFAVTNNIVHDVEQHRHRRHRRRDRHPARPGWWRATASSAATA